MNTTHEEGYNYAKELGIAKATDFLERNGWDESSEFDNGMAAYLAQHIDSKGVE